MAAAPAQIITAQMMEPGIADASASQNPVLPSQELSSIPFPPSNVIVELVDAAHLPKARPDHVLLGALGDPRLKVVQPFPLDVSVEESEVIVNWAETDEFGTGKTLSAAIDDFSGSVRDLYHQLATPEAKLGADLQRIKKTLEQYIQPQK